MARREELWTVEVGRRIAKLKRTREQIAGLAALAEHARAVRIVSQYMKKYGTEGSPCELICNDLLDLLQRGRAGRGAIKTSDGSVERSSANMPTA